MMLYGRRISPKLGLCILVLLLSACSSLRGEITPTRYYVLNPVARDASVDAARAQAGPAIGVTPVDLPEYLNQPGITTRGPANEVVRAEFDQWAGPLADEVTRVVGENLSRMLPSDRVTVASSGRTVPLDYIVEIEIASFERDQSGQVQLIARWTVFRDSDQSLITMRTSRISRPAAETDYNSIVSAMSAALADLCGEIAQALTTGT
jgi:uncharacterized lipoprotein YmbA